MTAALWGFQAGNWRESEWNRMRGFPWCRGTREEGNWGSVPSSPRRLRGGGRVDGRGGVAKGGEIQREGRRAAWSLGATRGRPRQAGGGLRTSTAADGAAQRRRQRETEKQRGGR